MFIRVFVFCMFVRECLFFAFCKLLINYRAFYFFLLQGPKFSQANMRTAPIAQRIRTDNFMWMGSSQDDEEDDKKKII